MRNSQHSVSLGTFGLAFAIALSPAVMQSDGLTLSCKTGDTRLAELAVEVSGQDQIASFDPDLRIFDAWLSSGVDSAVVRAIPMDLGSQVWVNYYSDAGRVALMQAEIGGGEVSLDVEPGLTTLMVYVKAPGGASDDYTVTVHVGCVDCDEPMDCKTGGCDNTVQVCSVGPPVIDGAECDFGGLPGVCLAGDCTAPCPCDLGDVCDGAPCSAGGVFAGVCESGDCRCVDCWPYPGR